MISKPSACAATAVDSYCGAEDRLHRRHEEDCPSGKTVPDCHEDADCRNRSVRCYLATMIRNGRGFFSLKESSIRSYFEVDPTLLEWGFPLSVSEL